MKKIAAILFGFVILLLAGCGNAQPQDESLATIVDTILTESHFRGVVLVAQGDEIILREAYGIADIISGAENTVYSPFHLASITKQFTAAAILLLEQDGKLDTYDTLDNFFDLPDTHVTVAHLLAMRGGFSDYTLWMVQLADNGEFARLLSLTADDIEAQILSTRSLLPQARPLYCNSDYWLLGRIVEQASGMSYEEFVRTRLFEPLGMENSGFGGSAASVAPHGIDAIHIDGQNVFDARGWPFHFLYATGGLVSTVDDLNIWLDAYFGGVLFPPHLLNDMGGQYNYGWGLANAPIWHHSGSMFGFHTKIIYDRDRDTRIILLSNENRAGFLRLVEGVSEAVLGTRIGHIGIQAGN